MRTWPAGVAVALLLATVEPVCGQGAVFQGLGDLAGGRFASGANAVSADGSTVVGWSISTSGTEAFRWTSDGGMVGLGDMPGGRFASEARGVSADGSVVVGMSISGNGQEAFRWTAVDGMVSLGDLPDANLDAEACGVSREGTIVVGRGRSASGTESHTEAFRWTQPGGMVGLGDLAGGSFHSQAQAITFDGTVIVGQSYSGSGYEAFAWTQATGLSPLGDLPGGRFASFAYGVSSDGTVVVGYGSGAAGFEAFRWTQAGGMVGLGCLPGAYTSSFARAVSADGSVVVGNSASAAGRYEAFVWTATQGMVNLREMLAQAYGLNMTGWRLENATGISADGRTIAGSGYDPTGQYQAWVVRLPVSPLAVNVPGSRSATFCLIAPRPEPRARLAVNLVSAVLQEAMPTGTDFPDPHWMTHSVTVTVPPGRPVLRFRPLLRLPGAVTMPNDLSHVRYEIHAEHNGRQPRLWHETLPPFRSVVGQAGWWGDRVVSVTDLAGQQVTLCFSAKHTDG